MVAALGDSLVQGYGLPAADGFVPQLQARLDSLGADVRMINAGVSGDTTSGGLARIDWTLASDVDAVIVSLGGNDVLRGFDPAFTRDNLRQILTTIAARDLPVLLIGIQSPSNFGPDYKAEFEAIFPGLAEEFATLLYPNFLGAIASEIADGAALNQLMQDDNIHPNAEGVKIVVADLLPFVQNLAERAAHGE